MKVKGHTPKLAKDVWVAPNATIIGEVEIGERSTVWFGTVIRGDVFAMRIGKETNIQDNCVLHGTYGECGVTLGDRVTIGHQVILHGCEVQYGSLIGMGSIIMDKAVIGPRSLVAAGSLVTEGAKFEEGVLIMGRPAKVKRKLTEQELKSLEDSADHYLEYATWYHDGKGKSS